MRPRRLSSDRRRRVGPHAAGSQGNGAFGLFNRRVEARLWIQAKRLRGAGVGRLRGIRAFSGLAQSGLNGVAEADQRPAQTQLDVAVPAAKLARQFPAERLLLALRHEGDGAAPRRPGKVVVGIAQHVAGDPTPGALVPDLRKGMQRLAASLSALGAQFSAEPG